MDGDDFLNQLLFSQHLHNIPSLTVIGKRLLFSKIQQISHVQ